MTMNRRRFIASTSTIIGSAVSNDVLATDASSASSKGDKQFTCVRTPQSTAGPYYNQSSPNRRGITEGRPGLPLRLGITISSYSPDKDCVPLKGAIVDIWHADASGQYSNVSSHSQNEDTTGKHFLRGHQLTNETGYVEFDSIVPGWEIVAAPRPINVVKRTPHIHVKVFYANAEATTQLYFPDDFMDNVFANFEPYKSNNTTTAPGVSGSHNRIHNNDDGIFRMDQSHPMLVKHERGIVTSTALIGIV